MSSLKASFFQAPETKQFTIRVRAWSNSARTVRVQGMTASGPIWGTLTTNADRTYADLELRLPELPSLLRVGTTATPVRRGELFVAVALMLGGIAVAILTSGYVTDQEELTWPGGKQEGSLAGRGLLRSVAGTNPAAGAEISETVPTNARWKLMALKATLVCSSDTATRRVTLVIDDGTTTLFTLTANDTQAASSTLGYEAVAGYPTAAEAANPFGVLHIPLPVDLFLLQGWRIRTSVASIQVKDDWGAPQLLVEEWLEE